MIIQHFLTSGTEQWILRGSTNYGDSVADEWVIVWLLRDLSQRFDNAWIRVFDTDGEFLLIEAAEMLPRWLNPEIAEGRIWINKGRLMIIPPNQSAAKDAKDPKDRKASEHHAKALNTDETLNFILSSPTRLLHSPLIEEEAFYRIRGYPSTILTENMHYALLTIPRKLAYILHRNPRYLSPAIEAFYLRDPISLKPLKSTPLDDMSFPPKDLVTVSVRFSKVMFAQIRSQDFVPPPTWAKAISDARSDATVFQKADAGMKISCGFEMLLLDPGNRDKQVVRELNVLLEDISSGEEELPSDAEIKTWNQHEDSETWLDIDFESFERELGGRDRPSPHSTAKDAGVPVAQQLDAFSNGDESGFGDKVAQDNLRKMVARFESFINSGDAENAEYLDDMDHDDASSADSDEDSEEDHVAGIDDEDFERAMREMMGLPPEQRADAAPDVLRRAVREIEEYNESDEEAADEAEEVKKMAEEMEKELNGMGALNIDGNAAGFADLTGRAPKTKGKQKAVPKHG